MAKIKKNDQKMERKAQMHETNNALPSFVTFPLLDLTTTAIMKNIWQLDRLGL
jgi:hypothetical protein